MTTTTNKPCLSRLYILNERFFPPPPLSLSLYLSISLSLFVHQKSSQIHPRHDKALPWSYPLTHCPILEGSDKHNIYNNICLSEIYVTKIMFSYLHFSCKDIYSKTWYNCNVQKTSISSRRPLLVSLDFKLETPSLRNVSNTTTFILWPLPSPIWDESYQDVNKDDQVIARLVFHSDKKLVHIRKC